MAIVATDSTIEMIRHYTTIAWRLAIVSVAVEWRASHDCCGGRRIKMVTLQQYYAYTIRVSQQVTLALPRRAYDTLRRTLRTAFG